MSTDRSNEAKPGIVSLADEDAVKQVLVNTADEAIALLREQHARWASP